MSGATSVPFLFIGTRNYAKWNSPTSQTNAQQQIKQTAVSWTLASSAGTIVSSGLTNSTYVAPSNGLYAIYHSMGYTPSGGNTTVQQWIYIVQSSLYTSGPASASNNRHGSVAGYSTNSGVQLQSVTYLHLLQGDSFSIASYSTGAQVATTTSASNEISIELLHYE